MQRGIFLFTIIHSIHQCRIFKKGTVLYLLGDSCQLLIYDPAGAHV